MLARRIRRDVADRGRDVGGVIDQYLRFVKPAYDNFVLPSSRHADIIVPGFDNGVSTLADHDHMTPEAGNWPGRHSTHFRARQTPACAKGGLFAREDRPFADSTPQAPVPPSKPEDPGGFARG